MTRKTWLTNLHMTDSSGSSFSHCHLEIRGTRIGKIVMDDRYFKVFGHNARVIDCEGGWVGAGFRDGHTHPLAYGISLDRVRLDGLSPGKIIAVLESHAASGTTTGWVRGRGWEDAFWTGTTKLDKRTLDRIFGDRPVMLSSKDGHSVWLSSAALKGLGIDRYAEDPPGGRFERLENSREISGILRENAAEIALNRQPAMPENEKLECLKTAFADLNRKGITAIHAMDSLDTIFLFRKLADSGESTLRVLAYFQAKELETALEAGLETGQGDDWLRIGGLKLYADGALGSRTALVEQPYPDSEQDMGIAVTSREALTTLAVSAAGGNLATAVHAIGDRAVSNAVHALGRARQINRDLPGLRVEHIQLLNPDDLPRFKRFRIAASIQPLHLVADIPMVERYWSRQTGIKYPCKTFADQGVDLLFGSDIPIEDGRPLKIVRAAVDACADHSAMQPAWVKAERVDRFTAMRCITGAAFPGEFEGTSPMGLQSGNPADLVVLSENPMTAALDSLDEIFVRMTFAGGRRVFSI